MTDTLSVNRPRIVVTAPSRAVTAGEDFSRVDVERIECAKERLESLGWDVREMAHVRGLYQRFSGTDIERTLDLMRAVTDASADLVMALRGGYGAARLLPHLDFETIAGCNAPLIGFSDTTALTMAFLAKARRPSWQGPSLSIFSREDEQRDRFFMQAMGCSDFRLQFQTAYASDLDVSGMLWGGNLSIIVSLLETDYFPHVDGGILFVEDVAEPAWRVERMLDQLANAGILRRQRAVLIGDMRGADKSAGAGEGRFALEDALSYIARKVRIPLVTGLPFGHMEHMATLPVGVQARIVVQDGKADLTACDCPVPAQVPGQTLMNNWWI